MTNSTRDGDHLESSNEVYLVYGSVMHAVQYWELALAVRAWRKHTPPVAQREAESRSAARAVARIEKAFTRTTASQARKELEGELPDEMLEAVSELIVVRNQLAHRFLRDQQVGEHFAAGTLQLLGAAGARFDASIRAVMEESDRLDDYDGVIRSHWPAVADTIVERLFSGESVDLEQILDAANEGPDGHGDAPV